MVTIDSLQFDTVGWVLRKSSEAKVSWGNANGDRLRKRFSDRPPKLPSPYALDELREYYRSLSRSESSGLISVDVLHAKGLTIVRSLFKHRMADDRCSYMGVLAFPFRDFSFTVQIQAVEAEHEASSRESAVREHFEQLWKAGTEVRMAWEQDPYDASYQEPPLRCLADDERWDPQFPDHPLSRIRAAIGKILPSLVASRELKNAVPYRGPQDPAPGENGK
jgi:hypothetical protein